MTLPKRKKMRLPGWDYSQKGVYFITICTHHHQCVLGEVVGAIHESPAYCKLSWYGEIVSQTIMSLPSRYPMITIDHYVVMPNHVHLIITIGEAGQRAIHESPLQGKRALLPKIIGYLKMNATKMVHEQLPEATLWQRTFYDHIIRNQPEYEMIWQYVDTNPAQWDWDCHHRAQKETL